MITAFPIIVAWSMIAMQSIVLAWFLIAVQSIVVAWSMITAHPIIVARSMIAAHLFIVAWSMIAAISSHMAWSMIAVVMIFYHSILKKLSFKYLSFKNLSFKYLPSKGLSSKNLSSHSLYHESAAALVDSTVFFTMAKDKLPSDLTSLPHANLFGNGISKGNDAFDDKRKVKSSQNNEILDYFNALSDAEHESILRNLRADKEQEQFMSDHETKFPTPYPVKVEPMTEEIKKAELYDNIMQEKRKREIASKYGPSTIPSHELSLGLQITLSSCTERDLKRTMIIIGKHEHGNDAITRKKTRDKVVKSLDPKISAGNISRMLTSNDAAEYHVAVDALSWQSTMKTIYKFCTQYDMTSLLLIPQGVDLSKPDQVTKAQIFKDAIDNWQVLNNKEYYKWHESIFCFGTFEETTSNNWLDDVLHMSMETTLHAEIESDIIGIPIQQRGSITTLRCIIKCMVIKNHEAKDALENYIRDFDITKFPGENVPTACLRLKAVARALGDDDLPSNTIRKVLEGFGKLSTKLFNDFYSSQIALCHGSFYADIMQGTSLQSQLNNLLNDIEVTYLDLVGGNSWLGIAAAPTQSSFTAKVQQDEEDEHEA
jgi:hypothetical protein